MLILIERDLKSASLLRIDDVREIDVVIRKDGDDTVYEVRANFDSTDGYENDWRLVHYKTRESAEAYHRFIGMTIARASMKRETACIVPHLTEEKVLKLAKRFAEYDEEDEARQQVAEEMEEAGLSSKVLDKIRKV